MVDLRRTLPWIMELRGMANGYRCLATEEFAHGTSAIGRQLLAIADKHDTQAIKLHAACVGYASRPDIA